MYSNICYTCSLSNFQFIVENNPRCYFAMWLVHKTQMNCNSLKIPSSSCNILELWKNKCDVQGERCKIKGAVIKLECYALVQHPCQIMVQNNQLSKKLHDIGRLLFSIWLSFAPYLVQLDNKWRQKSFCWNISPSPFSVL